MTYQFDDDSVLEDLLNEQLIKRKSSSSDSMSTRQKQPSEPTKSIIPSTKSVRFDDTFNQSVGARYQEPSEGGNAERKSTVTDSMIPRSLSSLREAGIVQQDLTKKSNPSTTQRQSWSDMKSNIATRSSNSQLSGQRNTTSASAISSYTDNRVELSDPLSDQRTFNMPDQRNHALSSLGDIQSMTKQELISLVKQQSEHISVMDMEQQQCNQIIKRMSEKSEREMVFFKELYETKQKLFEETQEDNSKRIESKYLLEIKQLELKCDNLEAIQAKLQQECAQQKESLEAQYKDHLSKIEANHERYTAILTDQHKNDLARLNNLKEQELQSVVVVRDNGANLDRLLAEWSEKIQQVTAVYDKELEKRQSILDKQSQTLDESNEQIVAITRNLSNSNVDNRNHFQEYSNLVQEHKTLFVELSKLSKNMVSQMEAFNQERKQLQSDSLRQQEDIAKERSQVVTNITLFGEKILSIEEQTRVLQKKESELNDKERKLKFDMETFQQEQNIARINRKDNENKILSSQIDFQNKQQEMTQEEAKLKRWRDELDQKSSEIEKVRSDLEIKGQELRHQNSEAMRLRDEARSTQDEVERIRKDILTKEKLLTKMKRDIEENKMKYSLLYKTYHAEMQQLQRLKQSLICSLCSSRLFSNGGMGAKISVTRGPDIIEKPYDINHLDHHELNYSARESCHGLIERWKEAAIKDEKMLREETAFVKTMLS